MSFIDLSQDPTAIEEQIAAAPRIILQFSSPSCSVCHAVLPRIKEIGSNYGWPVVDINVDEHPSIAAQRLIFSVPTVLVLDHGKELLRESRFIAFDQIERILGQMSEAQDNLI